MYRSVDMQGSKLVYGPTNQCQVTDQHLQMLFGVTKYCFNILKH